MRVAAAAAFAASLAAGITTGPAKAQEFINVLTGGTSGVSYLRKMLEVELFPELWKLRTEL